MRIGFSGICLIVLIANAGHAQEGRAGDGTGGVYKCTDKQGAVTYSSSPCKGAKREFLSKEKLERKTMTVESPKPVTAVPEVPAAPGGEPPAKPSPAPVPATAARAESPEPLATGNAVAPATLPAQPKIRRLPIEKKKKD